MEIKKLAEQYGYHMTIAVAYIAALLWMLAGVVMGSYHVMQHPAFLTDSDFFMEWLPLPGGVGAYLSLFLEQYFYMTFWGGFALIAEIMLTAWLLVTLMGRIFDTKYGAKTLLWLLPLFASMVCVCNIYFDFSTITRLALMLAVMNLVHLLPSDSKILGAMSAVGAVAVYHFCGPLYLYSFCAAELVLASIKKIRFVDFVWTAGVTAFYPVLMYRFVMPLTPDKIFYFPVATRTILEQFQPTIALLFALVPLTIIGLYIANKIKFNRPARWHAAAVILMAGVVVMAFRSYDNRRERFSARMAWESEQGNWLYVINNAKNFSGYDRNTNFYYDLALAMTGQMSTKLFEYPQLLGNEGLLIEKPMAGSVCFPTSTMYFNIGQISAALHYAHESHIYYRHSPYVIRRIIDCLVISGRYDEAEMFLKQLERNMLAKNFVKSRRQFIAGKYTKMLPKEFVEEKQKTAVKRDYIMSPPFRNFEQLFLANKGNQPALDYLLCYCLLDKDMENFFNVLEISGYDKNNLPKHYQEAVAIYKATTQHPRRYATEAKLNPTISRRFVEFGTIANKMGEQAYNTLKQSFADTYWIYYTFENPMRKNFSLQKNHPE